MRHLKVLPILIPSVASVSLFSNLTIPLNLTSTCSNALLADVKCNPTVSFLRSGTYYNESLLSKVCTSDCSNALASYEAKIASSCGKETWTGNFDKAMPVMIIADLIRYEYNLTCITDNGRYCNNVAAAAANAVDQDGSDRAAVRAFAQSNNTAITSNSTRSNITTLASSAVNPCDLCLIKNLQFQAGSPYFDGPDLALNKIYESKTSSCKVTGYPLRPTSSLSFYTPPPNPTATPVKCAGKTYNIQKSDTCYSISKSQGISTGWLLTDNQLDASCANFPTNGTLCLAHTCKTYTLKQGDTCAAVAQAHNVSEAQFVAWNPVISPGCNNIATLNGTEMCISSPGTPYQAPSSSPLAPLTPTTAAAVPTDVADGTNHDCGTYYQAVPGDYCNLITIKFGISLDDFVFLNPAINANCTNLYAYESYCVAAVGDINTYSGRPGHINTPTVIAGFTPFSALPMVSTTTAISIATGLPLANGSRSDCEIYLNGTDFQGTPAFFVSICQQAAVQYGVDPVAFSSWNKLNTSDPACSFQSNLRYCAKLYLGDAPEDDSVGPLYPVPAGVSPNCTYYDNVYPGRTCADILFDYNITIAQFFQYNPSVKNDCSGLQSGASYCVDVDNGDDDDPPTTTSPPTSGPTDPVQSGQPSNCNNWYTAQSGDSCSSVADKYFITLQQFYKWNPAVSSDCSSGFWGGYAYCVGTTDSSGTRPPTTGPTTTTTSVPAPTPNQANNAVSNCNKYAQTQSGDYCSLFAQRHGISLTNLYAWNRVLGSDGSGCTNQFWAGYYYCVGVSGK